MFRGITGINPERVSDGQEGEVATVSIQAHHSALEQLDHTGQYQKCIIISGIHRSRVAMDLRLEKSLQGAGPGKGDTLKGRASSVVAEVVTTVLKSTTNCLKPVLNWANICWRT